ncbi:NAD(P)-binding domain-containing protein [Nocardia stercoris]|uniref:NAD(P)-dependent oxidoreductase n=1 Tax=Nocardia stercoris TaxID=2483361 RepID=A0A3M2L6B4_9NOCA|nr:NAD(P)-binding domain-containing protein [Nocardia stercoris]RMI31455.1 NAD(P)-dependent oxidoreductase [Nocardia stercoris]
MTTIALLHPGRMGAPVAAHLALAGNDVIWHPPGRSADSQRRADTAGLRPVTDPVELLSEADIVISICPWDAADQVVSILDDRRYEPSTIFRALADPTSAPTVVLVNPAAANRLRRREAAGSGPDR